MKKETIEYFRDKNNISNYSYLKQPKQLSEESILDFLCEWSKDKNVKIYTHSLKKQEENFDKYDAKFVPSCDPTLRIPYCDWVYYLDIYYQ